MTATLSADRAEVLSTLLAELYVERKQLLTEIAPAGSGDDADRATNVDGHIRLAMLEHRIVAVENELADRSRPRPQRPEGAVAMGDIVTVDLGDGPETFLLGPVEMAADGMDVITPTSPLGQVLQGATIGATLTYAARGGRKLQAKVLAVR